MQSRAARVLRGFFYFVLGYVSLFVGSAICQALGRPDDLGVSHYLHDYFFENVIVTAVLMGIAVALRFWAVRAEKLRPPTEKRNRMTLRRALLLYRFNRPAATIARIVFYLWATLVLLLYAIGSVALAFEDPRLIPGLVISLSGFVGWAAALRYWAASLDARAGGEMGRVA